MNKMTRNQNKGFTLTEIMVTLSIFVVVMGAIYSTFAVGNRSWLMFNTNSMLQRETRNALIIMTRELRKAKNILVIKEDSGLRMNFVRSPMGSVSYLWSTEGPDAHKLIRKNQSNTKVLANNVLELSFENLNDAILIDITSGVKNPSGEVVKFHLKEKVARR